jgi:CRISPR-associated protein Cas4
MHFSDGSLNSVHVVAEFVYCPRSSYYLMTGAESAAVGTAGFREGAIMHGRVDAGGRRSLRGDEVTRSFRVVSTKLGLVGVIDQVKAGRGGDTEIWEYKRGKTRPSRIHEVQVALLALCYEETAGRRPATGVVWTTGDRRARRFPINRVLLDEAERAAYEFAVASHSASAAAWPRHRQAGCAGCVFRYLCWDERELAGL